MMAKKFDTNPLDPDFPEKARKTQREEVQTSNLRSHNGETRQFADPFETEQQTKKFDEAEFDSYQTPFGDEDRQPVNYQPRPVYDSDTEKNKSHNIGSISLPENILIALPYIPFMIGLIAGVIELFFIPKSEPKVRFHAAQGVAAHIGILIVTSILGLAANVTDLAGTASGIFSVITTIMLIIFAFKAWQGKPIHIESVESLTDWLEDKIKPQR